MTLSLYFIQYLCYWPPLSSTIFFQIILFPTVLFKTENTKTKEGLNWYFACNIKQEIKYSQTTCCLIQCSRNQVQINIRSLIFYSLWALGTDPTHLWNSKPWMPAPYGLQWLHLVQGVQHFLRLKVKLQASSWNIHFKSIAI